MGKTEHTLRPPAEIGDLLELISQVYDHRLKECGPGANGVFWKHREGQDLRHEVLLQLLTPSDLCGGIEINDLGCGYGAFFEMIRTEPLMTGSKYRGYDISVEMIDAARMRNFDTRASFTHGPRIDQIGDYSFASGTFNMFLGANEQVWDDYVKSCLKNMWNNSRKGMAFNMLDRRSSKRLLDLYYADPDEMFGFAKTMTPDVKLVDDYQLDEWTIFMRR